MAALTAADVVLATPQAMKNDLVAMAGDLLGARLLGAAGLAGADGSLALPERMAPVNALLDACPPAPREALLLGVLDRLSRPTAT